MVIDFLRKLLLLAVFCLAQVLVLNHIHLFGVATPLLYAYFVLMFRADYPRWGIIMWSFVLGVVLDMFSNTARCGRCFAHFAWCFAALHTLVVHSSRFGS